MTDDTASLIISTRKWEGFWSNSSEGVILNVDRTEEMMMNKVSSAKCFPGQILSRRKPCQPTNCELTKKALPSSKAESRHAGIQYIGIYGPILDETRGVEFLWVGVISRIMQYGPIVKNENVKAVQPSSCD